MALTPEERAQAQIHAIGALQVHDQMQAQIKATEEDILQKIQAFKIIVDNEIKARASKPEELSVVKDATGVHEAETTPGALEPFHEETSKQIQEGNAKLKKPEDKKAAEKEAKKQDKKASKAGHEYHERGFLPEDEQAIFKDDKKAFGSPNTDKPDDDKK